MSYSLGAINTTLSLTKDRGLRLGFTTNELTEAEKTIVIEHFQRFGKVTFEPDESA